MDPLMVRLVTCHVPVAVPAGMVNGQSNPPEYLVPVVGVENAQVFVSAFGPVSVIVADVIPEPASYAANVKLVVSAVFVMPASVFGEKSKAVNIGAGNTVTRE